jgi:hypothetical protein
MITTALKSNFYIIVALASIVGSVIATPYISNFVGVAAPDPPSFTPPIALAQSLPLQVDHHVKIKERTGDPLRVEEWMNYAERNCEMSCVWMEFRPGTYGKAGLAYISDNPMDLSGADRVHFFLMGEKGGETVKVYLAGKNPSADEEADSLFKEKFALSTDVITLTNNWERYEISLEGVDLRGITAPFAIELLGNTSAVQAAYYKFIVYENRAVDPRFEVEANSTDTTDNATALTAEEDNATAPTPDTSEQEITNTTTNATATPTPVEGGGQADENLAPIAMPAVDRLVANPGDRVILDGSLSSDPDGDVITYQWSQSDGPEADIQGSDTVTPAVTIPNLDRNDQITIDLVVSDGQAESNRASVVIDIQYVEELEGAIQQNLQPDEDRQARGWSDASCDGDGAGVIVECMTDSSDSTFVSSDTPGVTTDMLFSFQDPSSAGINASNQIAYVTAQVTAKKTGASGFASLIVDNPTNNEHYSTPSISIASDLFEEYEFTWKSNPITGEPWTIDSLNSLVAGYRYLAGQGSVQISEFKLIVGSLIPEVEQEAPEPSAPDDVEASTAEGSEGDNADMDSDDVDANAAPSEEPASTDDDAATEEGEPTEDDD